MLTNVTAATAAIALAAVLGSITVLLIRASRWPEVTPPPRHGLNPDGIRPGLRDETAPPEDIAPISAPPVDDEPIDELDPRWDWRAYADAAELVDA